MTTPVLELTDISKHLGVITALRGVSMSVAPGEIIGLMGDNDTGKSTLARIIAGNFLPSSGEMRISGQLARFALPIEARHAGIEIVQQSLALCDNLSAAQNVFLGRILISAYAIIGFFCGLAGFIQPGSQRSAQ